MLFTPSDNAKDTQKLYVMATFNALSGTEMSPLARLMRRKKLVPAKLRAGCPENGGQGAPKQGAPKWQAGGQGAPKWLAGGQGAPKVEGRSLKMPHVRLSSIMLSSSQPPLCPKSPASSVMVLVSPKPDGARRFTQKKQETGAPRNSYNKPIVRFMFQTISRILGIIFWVNFGSYILGLWDLGILGFIFLEFWDLYFGNFGNYILG